MSAWYFIHQRPSAISDELVWSSKYHRCRSAACNDCTYVVSLRCEWLLIPLMWKTSVSSFMKISPTLGGERRREWELPECFIDSVRSVCMQMTQCQIISKVNCWYLSLPTVCHYLSWALLIPSVLLCKQRCAEQRKERIKLPLSVFSFQRAGVDCYFATSDSPLRNLTVQITCAWGKLGTHL